MASAKILRVLRRLRSAQRGRDSQFFRRWFPAMRAVVAFAGVISLSSMLLFSFPSDSPGNEKHVSIYSTVANYSLAVMERDGRDYVGLLEALEPLGAVSASGNSARWMLRYNNAEAEFTAGSSRAQVRHSDFDLRNNFLLENGRGLVPLVALGPLLSRILGGPVTSHEAARRVFIGSVGVHFTAQMSNANPPSLVMNFTAPVNPMIATEPGKLRMVFNHEPLIAPGSTSLTFNSKTIPSAAFDEENGAAAVTISSGAPLFASFSNGNRTITISAAAQAQAAPAPTSQPAVSVTVQNLPAPAQPGAVSAATSAPEATSIFAVVDASHGGSERGEALSEQLAEKDVTLGFARMLRAELQARGLQTFMVREGDATLTLDQRAALANTTHPVIYISVHASSEGHGVRLYTALLPVGGNNAGPFVDYDTAQMSFLPVSRVAVSGLELELNRKQIPVRVLMAPLRPLNNIAAAAVAVELAPPVQTSMDLSSAAYQQQVAAGVASGVLSVRDKLAVKR